MNSSARTLGFTLIEMMTVLVVLAILASMAAPSFTRLLRSNRANVDVSKLLLSVQLARTEAIRGTTNACIVSTGWSDGWQVRIDADRNGACTAGAVLKVFPALQKGSTLTVVNAAGPAGSVMFDRLGGAVGSIRLQYRAQTGKCDKDIDKDMTIGLSGRLEVTSASCNS